MPLTLSDEVLWKKTYDARAQERITLTELLEFLQEIERRKLHLERGFESLFTFLVKGLGYEEGSAYRRLQTLHAMNSTPEIKEHLAQGSLTLTNIAATQGLIKALEKNRAVPDEEKRALFKEVQNKSKRATEQIILSRAEKEGVTLRGVTTPADLIRATSPAKVEIRFQASKEFEEKLQRLRDLYFKKRPGASLEDIFTWAVEETLNRHDPIQRDARARTREVRAREKTAARRMREAASISGGASIQGTLSVPSAASVQGAASARRPAHEGKEQAPNPQPPTQHLLNLQPLPAQTPKPTPYRPSLSASTRRLVRQRSQFRCQYRDPPTGRRCEETKTLEIDHQVPLIFGGSSTPENLQVLCRAHHRAKGFAA